MTFIMHTQHIKILYSQILVEISALMSLDIGGDINITTALATGTSTKKTILKVRLPFTSGLKECFGSIGFKDFINNGTGAKPTFELKLGALQEI